MSKSKKKATVLNTFPRTFLSLSLLGNGKSVLHYTRKLSSLTSLFLKYPAFDGRAIPAARFKIKLEPEHFAPLDCTHPGPSYQDFPPGL